MCQDFESHLPLGEIHKFRTNLFAEHLGLPHPLFKDPGSESCARYIRESAWQNWKDYEASTSSAHSKFFEFLKKCNGWVIIPIISVVKIELYFETICMCKLQQDR